jgi:two-component system, NtrC family, response regulator GlrR
MIRVLVIDDDHAQRFLFAQLLKRTGFEVETSTSGDTALELLIVDSRFDVILTDLRMPGTNGQYLIHELQTYYPQIPVVLMSVLGLTEWPDQTAFGLMIYLQKPFDRRQLVDAIRKAIDGNRTTPA